MVNNKAKVRRKELIEAPKYELLASHDMRRSFATYHFDKGVSVNLNYENRWSQKRVHFLRIHWQEPQ